MKKETLLLLLLAMMLLSSKVCSQNDYYWSGGKKIILEIDSSKIVLSARTVSDLTNLKSKVLLINNVKDASELSVGRFKSFEIRIDRKSFREIYKNVSNISEAGFVHPFYIHDKVPFYFTNEIVLKPKNQISIDQILQLADNQLSIKEKTQYNTYLLQIEDTKN